jgi:hypothetical protein
MTVTPARFRAPAVAVRRPRATVAGPATTRRVQALPLVAVLVVAALPADAGAVVAGRPAEREDHPAVVTLADACTATLVAPDRLLTAGHCVSHVSPGRTTVRIGGASVVASRVARHPRYQYLLPDEPAEPYRDVGLVELEAPVTDVRPVRVPRPGAALRLVGYGTGDPHEPGHFGVLRTADLVVRADDECRDGLESALAGQGAQYRPAVMLCTQDADGRAPYASGCNGDSGAPLLRRTRGGRDVVVGVDSWGVACGAEGGDPEVFARLSAEAAFVLAADPGWTTTRIPEPLEPGRG